MKKTAGKHPQIWCRIHFTHRLCSGYRSENSSTLRRFGVNITEDFGKIELLCSCSCHDRARTAVGGIDGVTMEESDFLRFHNALDTTLELVGTSIRVESEREEEDAWTEQMKEEMKNVEQLRGS